MKWLRDKWKGEGSGWHIPWRVIPRGVQCWLSLGHIHLDNPQRAALQTFTCKLVVQSQNIFCYMPVTQCWFPSASRKAHPVCSWTIRSLLDRIKLWLQEQIQAEQLITEEKLLPPALGVYDVSKLKCYGPFHICPLPGCSSRVSCSVIPLLELSHLTPSPRPSRVSTITSLRSLHLGLVCGRKQPSFNFPRVLFSKANAFLLPPTFNNRTAGRIFKKSSRCGRHRKLSHAQIVLADYSLFALPVPHTYSNIPPVPGS